MGANTMAINHFIDFRICMSHSPSFGRFSSFCKDNKKKALNQVLWAFFVVGEWEVLEISTYYSANYFSSNKVIYFVWLKQNQVVLFSFHISFPLHGKSCAPTDHSPHV